MLDTENELIKARLKKLQKLRDRGINPYPSRYHSTHNTKEATELFKSEEQHPEDKTRSSPITIAGRIISFRGMGNATFADLLDGAGRIQVLFRRNNLENTYEILDDIDIGDWLGIQGPIFRTRTGELTVEVHQFTVLSKSLRPLPEKWHGLADVETRYRQRYLDLIANEEIRRITLLRSQLITSIRHFMERRGFIEVETPILVPVAAGAMAHPFTTHHNVLNRDLFLRIATELYLKRLIVGGIEKVYEIGKVFRNEGVDFYHNPEYTLLESYEAYADYTDVMDMLEQMVSTTAQDVLDTTTVDFDDQIIDLSPPWTRLDLHSEIKKHSGIDFHDHPSIESLRTAIDSIGIDVSQQASWGGLMDKLISVKVEPRLIQPSFLIDYPVEMSPLAKRKQDDPRLTERFEAFIGGMEISNAFTELNDPIDQRKRLEHQEKLRTEFQDEEMDRLDEDFLIAIEHGMPPTGGLGIGIDRLAMILSGQRTIREVILFPQLRSR